MTDPAAREVLLVAHPGHEELPNIARQVSDILGAAHIGLRTLDDGLNTFLAGVVSSSPVAPDAAAAVGCEMVLVLGGDGTFLRAAEFAKAADVPILGINLGHIGFLAEAEADHLADALAQVVERHFTVEPRMTLDVAVRVGDSVVERSWALNEASIENASHLGVLEVITEVDGRPVSSFGCDGVLVSSPTGSTAYAFSAGGPVMWPQLEAILVVPSNAHALFSRALVTAPDSLIAVETVAGGHESIVVCDGQRSLQVPPGGRIEVVRGHQPLKWMRLDSAPFSDRLVRKFELPVTGWRGRGH
jgi:NAD+ kinase